MSERQIEARIIPFGKTKKMKLQDFMKDIDDNPPIFTFGIMLFSFMEGFAPGVRLSVWLFNRKLAKHKLEPIDANEFMIAVAEFYQKRGRL